MKRRIPKKLLSLWAGTLLIALFIAPAFPARAALPVFTECAGTQEAEAVEALQNARALAGSASAYLAGVAESQRVYDAPYATWFGAYDGWRYRKVLSNFEAIGSALDRETLSIACTCGTHALGDEYTLDQKEAYAISLCSKFWAAPPTGWKSRAGAIVEAMSRFNAVVGAKVKAPTQIESMTLASEKPADAIQSASSYRYFAEEEKTAGAEHLALAVTLILLLLLGEHLRRGRARSSGR